MALMKRRILARALEKRQAQIARTRPSLFAANRIAKSLSTSHAPGVPLKTATVFYDRKNAVTGRALEREFTRRGVKTQGIGLIGRDPNTVGRDPKSLKKLSRAEAVVFLTGGRKSQFDSFADLIVEQAEARKKTKRGTRLALIYGIEDMKSTRTLAATAKQASLMREFSRKTFNAVRGAREIRVITPAGANLTFTLSPRIRWGIDNGIITKNYWGNLPAGEVFTAPLRVNGTAIIDGAMFGVGRTEKTPIRVQIKDGRAILGSISCASESVKRKFIKQLTSDRNSSRIGELGLGTNVTIKKVMGNDLVDEKIPGVHIAFGDPYAADTGARWKSEEHNDGILLKPTIIVDGKTIMRNGKSLLI